MAGEHASKPLPVEELDEGWLFSLLDRLDEATRMLDNIRLREQDARIRLIERKAGLGTSITAESEIRTVIAENRTALPAVSIVSATACSTGCFEPKNAPRKRITMNSA